MCLYQDIYEWTFVNVPSMQGMDNIQTIMCKCAFNPKCGW